MVILDKQIKYFIQKDQLLEYLPRTDSISLRSTRGEI